MGNLLAYSGTTTKIRAIQSRFFTQDDYRELAAQKSVPDAVAYIKKHPGYQELFANMDEATLHRNEIEKILTNAVYVDFQKIYRFATIHQRGFLDMYFKRYEVAILKRCMRMVFDHRDFKLDLSLFYNFFEKHSDLDLNKLAKSRTIEELVANLKGSIYYERLNRLSSIEHPTLFDYEMALDIYYFSWLWKNKNKALKKDALRSFMDAYGVKMDLLNIRWIYRCKKYYHMTNAEIYALLIPVQYHLKKTDIRDMVEAPTLDEFEAVVKKGYYAKHYPQFMDTPLDSAYNNIRDFVQHKNASQNPYSVATIIAFLYSKEHEISKLTIALECIRYGLSPSETLEYITH